MNISQKLLVITVMIGLAPMVIISSLAMSKIHHALTTQAFKQLHSVNQVKKAQIGQFFQQKQQDMAVLLAMIANLKQQAYQRLQSIQAHKKAQLEAYFQDIVTDSQLLAQSYAISQALYQFDRAYKMTQGDIHSTAWQITEDRFGLEFQRYQQRQGYDDLLLINKTGEVVYSVAKGGELGQNVFADTLKNTPLSHGFQPGLTQLTLQEFAPYPFASAQQSAFIIAPVEHFGAPIGVLAIRLSPQAIDQILQRQQGMGRSGESYLVGKVNGKTIYRSHRLIKQQPRPVMGQSVQGVEINKALAGQTGIAIKPDHNGDLLLSAYAPLTIPGLHWGLITTLQLAQVLTPQLVGQGESFFEKYLNHYDYEDLLLIHPQGQIFYSVQHKPDYATNILTGHYANSQLGEIVQAVLKEKRFGISDYAPYPPSNYQPSAFLAQPLLDPQHRIELIIALQINDKVLNQIMQQRAGMGQTGESYLVGSDKLMRSNAYLSPTTHSIKASFANPLIGQVNTLSSNAALGGQIFQQLSENYQGEQVLSVATPVTVGHNQWALITEVHQSEALAALTQIQIGLSIFLVIISLITFIIIKLLTKQSVAPLLAINQHLKQLSQGRLFTENMTYSTHDEIGEIARSTLQLKNRLESTIKQAQAIANGDYTDEISQQITEKSFFSSDQLTMTLSQMTRSLHESRIQNAQQQWLKNGQTQLHEKISVHQNIIELAKHIIYFLTTYLNAQMGLFYLAVKQASENTPAYLKLIASYAFSSRKPFANEFQFGDGLVGQAALEQQMIIVSQLPNDYTAIVSGQGQAVPRMLLVAPFCDDKTVKGVIELATLDEFSPLQQEFLTSVMPYIATAVNARQIYDQKSAQLERVEILGDA